MRKTEQSRRIKHSRGFSAVPPVVTSPEGSPAVSAAAGLVGAERRASRFRRAFGCAIAKKVLPATVFWGRLSLWGTSFIILTFD